MTKITVSISGEAADRQEALNSLAARFPALKPLAGLKVTARGNLSGEVELPDGGPTVEYAVSLDLP